MLSIFSSLPTYDFEASQIHLDVRYELSIFVATTWQYRHSEEKKKKMNSSISWCQAGIRRHRQSIYDKLNEQKASRGEARQYLFAFAMEWFRFGLFLCIFFKSGFMLSVRDYPVQQAIDRIYTRSFFFKDLNTKALPTDLKDYRYEYINFLDSFHLYSSAAYAGLDICQTYDLRFLFSIR